MSQIREREKKENVQIMGKDTTANQQVSWHYEVRPSWQREKS